MNITNKGKKWELRNSLWIIWSFTLILGCIGFFWIGGRTGKRKWIVSGVIYLIINFGLIYVIAPLKSINTIYSNIATVIFCLGWFAAIVQSFMSRKEYLIRREAVIDLMDSTRDSYRNEIREDYFGKSEQPLNSSPLPISPKNTAMPQAGVQKVNLNICSEQDLANLPGVGIALAKRAIEIREQTGGFASVQDFNQRLGLMPHFTVQIENLAFVTLIEPKITPTEDGGRVIDI